MSLLLKGGISKLSELEIDAAPGKAKDIAELVLTTQGDILYRNTEAVRLPADYGIGYNFLHARNTGIDEPEWLDIQDLIIFLTGAVNRAIALPTLQCPVPVCGGATVAEDHSGGGHVAEPAALDVPVPTCGGEAVQHSPGAVDGAIADDGGAQTDETAEANSAAANDMTLLPATPAVNDAYYFGLSTKWNWLVLEIGPAGAGTWTITWEYWNGSNWVALPGVYDTSNGFRNGGTHSVGFHQPADWATSSIMLMDLYWIRARVSAYTSVTTQPLGTQAWIGSH